MSTILHSLGPLPPEIGSGERCIAPVQYQRQIPPTCVVVAHKEIQGTIIKARPGNSTFPQFDEEGTKNERFPNTLFESCKNRHHDMCRDRLSVLDRG